MDEQTKQDDFGGHCGRGRRERTRGYLGVGVLALALAAIIAGVVSAQPSMLLHEGLSCHYFLFGASNF